MVSKGVRARSYSSVLGVSQAKEGVWGLGFWVRGDVAEGATPGLNTEIILD